LSLVGAPGTRAFSRRKTSSGSAGTSEEPNKNEMLTRRRLAMLVSPAPPNGSLDAEERALGVKQEAAWLEHRRDDLLKELHDVERRLHLVRKRLRRIRAGGGS
jgi:hypothetical protein